MCWQRVRHVVVAAACLGIVAIAAASGDPDVDRLIQQLGSSKFVEREAAQKALDTVGTAALAKLEAAVSSSDPEISRRAKELVASIGRRAETQQALSTKRFKLQVKDLPVPDAVKELSTQAGVQVQLGGDVSKLAERRVTLETPELIFWEVLERFCKAAELTEVASPTLSRVTSADFESRPPGRVPRPPAKLGVLNIPPQQARAIQLVDGKAAAMPTTQRDALRIRAVAPPKDEKPSVGEGLVHLEVMLEPRLGWRSPPRLRVDESMDEKGQLLAQVTPEATPPDQQLGQIILNQNGRQVIVQQAVVIGGRMEMLGERYEPGSNVHRLPVRFRLPAEGGTTLQSLRGVLTGDLPLPAEPLVTVDNILDVAKSEKKSFKGKADVQLTINSIKKYDDGRVQLNFELAGEHNLAQAAGLNLANMARFQGQFAGEMPGLEAAQYRLLDTDGKAYRLTGSHSTMQVINNGQVSNVKTYTFSPPAEKSTPQQFVVSGSRLAKVEVPFTLTNVPLTR
jgi:hypothetical protein